ncbi:zinc finger protein [Saccharopolyspora sp. NPDC049357]|uniref:zinc finger protein n=1 Tax=Saccharopolyspora sp. NPDC049357 TaxID=3154507 RepID=UPI003427F5AE
MPEYLTYVWRPVPGKRHAFPVAATKLDAEETATAYCGAEVEAAKLHDLNEIAWILEPTCMDCWKHLTDNPPAAASRP